MNIQVCRDTSDAVALYLPQRLYLKAFAKLNICIQLPSHKVHNKSISNWELMEKLRKMIQPDGFSMLKVTKHSSEMIRFDAELEHRTKVERVLARLNDRVIQLNDYPDALKVKVSEAKSDFPSRHSWDSFFRDATDMDEMKPGERPDTVHIGNLPICWFVHNRDRDEEALPSETIFKKVFEKFGNIRQVDIPAADPYRMHMKAAMRGSTTPPQDTALYFDGYIQFSEYVGFVRCMDALRGHKLLRKRDDIAEWCGIMVDFDKTKHMTDAAVKRRAIVRERLVSRQRAKEDEEREEREKIAKRQAKERQKADRVELEKLEKMKEREERRKKKQLAKLIQRDNLNMNSKVADEQRKLLKAQKKLQAIRLIEELFNRIELRPELQHNGRTHRNYSVLQRSSRARIVDRYKRDQELAVEEARQQLKDALDGRVVIRSALETKKRTRASSEESLSSAGEDRKVVKIERLTTPEREMEYNKAAGMYGMHPYGFGYPMAAMQYAYPTQTSMYYPVRGAYYPPPVDGYRPRGAPRARARGRGRGHCRLPYFDGPDASHQYYMYFKKLKESECRNEHDDRTRSRSRSRHRSYSRSRSRRRSYTRSRSRSRSRSRRSRSRRSRSRSRRTRSRSRRSRSHHSRSRSRSRDRPKTRTRRNRTKSRSKSRSKSKARSPAPKQADEQSKEANEPPRARSKSWSLPKEGDPRKSWSKSPKEK